MSTQNSTQFPLPQASKAARIGLYGSLIEYFMLGAQLIGTPGALQTALFDNPEMVSGGVATNADTSGVTSATDVATNVANNISGSTTSPTSVLVASGTYTHLKTTLSPLTIPANSLILVNQAAYIAISSSGIAQVYFVANFGYWNGSSTTSITGDLQTQTWNSSTYADNAANSQIRFYKVPADVVIPAGVNLQLSVKAYGLTNNASYPLALNLVHGVNGDFGAGSWVQVPFKPAV